MSFDDADDAHLRTQYYYSQLFNYSDRGSQAERRDVKPTEIDKIRPIPKKTKPLN